VRVSFIITSRDEDPSVLAATVAGLRATAFHVRHEIVIVDDGSLVPVMCGGRGADVRVIRNAVPIGVCSSRRLGASAAAGDVLVWLDAHMSFGAGWLEQMLVHADARALICSPFWSYDLKDCLCWGADFVWSGTRDYRVQEYPGFGLRHRTTPPEAVAASVPMIIGACYLMRREAYAWLGGFSPCFRVWGVDEQDLSARAWIAGMQVRCATYARVGHLSRTAFPYPVQFEHLEFNQLAMIRTVFEPETITRLEAAFGVRAPILDQWLSKSQLGAWRQVVQSRRALRDADFFERFVPELAVARTSLANAM
jgi:GT2 family glycosyltransferase